MPRPTEADRWRIKAEDALRQAQYFLTIVHTSLLSLLRLQAMHQADDFGHCSSCKTVWPCETIQVVKEMAQALSPLSK